jgi:hypothetical protein
LQYFVRGAKGQKYFDIQIFQFFLVFDHPIKLLLNPMNDFSKS